jgi:feruloyl-CoA synthase
MVEAHVAAAMPHRLALASGLLCFRIIFDRLPAEKERASMSGSSPVASAGEPAELPNSAAVTDLFSVPRTVRRDRPDGSVLLESADALRPYPVSAGQILRQWAARDPGQTLIAERAPGKDWRRYSYGEATAAATAIGQALLDRGLSAERPLLILSGNSAGHFLMTMGALTAGIPVAPVSAAYSLQSRNHERIKAIGELVEPGAVYVEDTAPFGPALAALGRRPLVIAAAGGPGEHSLDTLRATPPGDDIERAFSQIAAGTIAKILFTSGSTGTPKGVLTTHAMLCANQQMIRQAWPFLERERPVLVDWLPWSHTFGGSHNVNLALFNGGSFYIDNGRPAPGLFESSLANYREIPPTLSFNVPAGYALLVPALEQDRELAERFFSRIRLIFNAAAALPPTLRARLQALGREVTGREIPVTGSWGTTETAPAATSAHYAYDDARCIGVPLPGVQLKLVPASGDSYEIRVRSAGVTPGYFRRPDLTSAAFDDEGFYCPGDAVSFADAADPDAGLLFHGRLAEDFKISTGTFVRVGAVRTALLSAAPILADAVICGENREMVCALAWLNRTETVKVLGAEISADHDIVHAPALAAYLGRVLAAHAAGTGPSARIERLLIMGRPASLDAGEITDKGYVNQRQVLATRADLVEALYAEPLPPNVIVPARE